MSTEPGVIPQRVFIMLDRLQSLLFGTPDPRPASEPSRAPVPAPAHQCRKANAWQDVTPFGTTEKTRQCLECGRVETYR